MNKRPFVAAAVTLATALVLGKLAGVTPSVEAPSGSDAEGATRGRPTAAPRQEAESPPAPTEPPLPVRAAVEDLAAGLGLPPEAVRVLGVEAVTWPDGSLGCPQPGMQYMQVLTEGFRVRLEAEGEQVEYHTDRETQVVRCEGGLGAPGAPTD